ncbi:MAG: ATP-dependent DNA ligase [Acidobacteria bacterium]|nr:MAG: ATP-dependent DNA ligase [Acidobacteriota bacterium]
MLSDFTAVANAIGATTKKNEKERLLAEYLSKLDDASLERAVVFFSGSPFPRRDERVTGIGGAAISDAVSNVTSRSSDEVWAAWSKYGDAGDTVAENFPNDPSRTITLSELGEFFERIAATQGAIEKKNGLAELLRKVNAQGARYIVKILTGELRIGLQEGMVESAIAKAFGRKVDAVRRANMFTGDIGATALLAKGDSLESAKMTLFHPFAFMLAQPEEDPEEIVAALGEGAFADDKYDGIRAQIHSDGVQVRIYSRTLDNVTHRFPEIEAAARQLGRGVILDGEIVAFSDRILPFAVIQTRLGRRKVTDALLRDAPVAFFAFDLLYENGEPLFELPLRERIERLREIIRDGAIRLSDQSPIRDAAHIDELFDSSRARANEGLVIKDPGSIYTPGRRGKSWLKYKKALATLDCVVTAAEYGHGKRRSVLSDYTFAVLRDGELVNIGKAYSGLTDVEIDQLTKHFKETTRAQHGPVHIVEPQVVLEIAFDRIQESARHKSGYALRFPRIVRIRDDKTVDQISTIDEVRRIYEGQLKREKGVSS